MPLLNMSNNMLKRMFISLIVAVFIFLSVNTIILKKISNDTQAISNAIVSWDVQMQ